MRHAACARSSPLLLASRTRAPSCAARTAEAVPTGPVPPSTSTFLPARVVPAERFKQPSTTATAAAAVVNAPLGSTNTDTSKGGTIARFAASSISSASARSRPPMKMPVRLTPFGPREKIASWVSVATSAVRIPAYGTTAWKPAS